MKEEIGNLATNVKDNEIRANVKDNEIRVTVKRKHFWRDFTRARNEYFCPTNTIKVTFCSEPAIDDRG